MDIEPNTGSRVNRFSNSNNPLESLSRRQSFMSLERLSSNRQSSLSNRVSLVNAMDLESSRNSKVAHDELLNDELSKRFSIYRRSSNKSKEQYEFQAEIEEKDLNRKSQYKIKHQCTCNHNECFFDHCICFLTPREICVIGQCCPQCIAIKNDYLQSTRGFQLQRQRKQKEVALEQNNLLQMIKQKNCKNLHYFKQVHANQPCMKNLIFCTCKKSHCQKKYCLCFQKGVKCNEFCVCIECQNKDKQMDEFEQQQQRRWERYATYNPYQQNQNHIKAEIDHEIEQFIECEQDQGEQFNQTMEFEPVNFEDVLKYEGR